MSINSALLQVSALADMIITSSEDPRWRQERQQAQEFICDMAAVICAAREQGSPYH